ncbi:MAG: hypothetical protein BEN18_04340 [Epulopiscium sp. Nuni2H_MBin001]|nr:MAG: hypothetical protein BEN18_04340 [Epulopiscium sp. Nuni2H_MBin001]
MKNKISAILAVSLLVSAGVISANEVVVEPESIDMENLVGADLVFYQDGVFLSVDNLNGATAVQVNLAFDDEVLDENWEFDFSDEFIKSAAVTVAVSDSKDQLSIYIDNSYELFDEKLDIGLLTFDGYDIEDYKVLFNGVNIQAIDRGFNKTVSNLFNVHSEDELPSIGIPDTPDPETPDTPDPETPDPDTPDPEIPDPETPDPDTPDPETPDPETPDTNNPDTETPDTDNPDTETPDTETPDTDNPDTETPDTETPDTETPDPDKPDTDNPDTENPDTETPDTENPDTDNPNTDNPDTDNPDTDNPNTDNPDTDNPDTDNPDTDTPNTDNPGTSAPSVTLPSTNTYDYYYPNFDFSGVIQTSQVTQNSEQDITQDYEQTQDSDITQNNDINSQQNTKWENPFNDVKPTDWYYEVVAQANLMGLFGGVSETEFAPNEQMTRAMLVTVIHRMANTPFVDATTTFEDVRADAWYSQAIAWATYNDLVGGYSETEFGTTDGVTREQLVTILWRYAGRPNVADVNLTEFKDSSSISDYAATAMAWAYNNGIINGKGNGMLEPKANATRAEVAAVALRYIEQN